ncbi:hypothetical protein LOD99_391 [Oopsacas minuta]|uniref:WW domain-containing protein n=1 Tax=Oopsacas minuta TaxID=111878 RepID=A0AAV7K930_9METZ|nr:hypothetical protein LOD99_391 [Oopsacas minuta]
MDKRDRGLLHYSRDQPSDSDWKKCQTRHSANKRNIHKKHSKHHPRYPSSETEAKRASYEENPLNWNECMSSMGRKYWFNVRTEKSQWEVPKAILLQRNRERENTRSKELSPSLYSGVNRKTNSSHSTDYIISSPRKKEDDIDRINTPESHPSVSTNSSRNLITSLHPLQQALLVKNQLQYSTHPHTLPISPSPAESIDSNPISPTEFIQPHSSRSDSREAPLLARRDSESSSTSLRNISSRSTTSLNNHMSSVASNLDKFANTPGIRIKKKPILSSSSSCEEAMKLLSSSDTVTPIAIVMPECPAELAYDAELIDLPLTYQFSSPQIEYTEKEINNKMLERLNTCYTDYIESSIMLTDAKLRWEIDNFYSQICSLRTKSIATLIEPEQRTPYK